MTDYLDENLFWNLDIINALFRTDISEGIDLA